MLFKSEKWWRSLCASALCAPWLSATVTLLLAGNASATITVTTVNPYSIKDDTAYFAQLAKDTPFVMDTDAGFKNFDFSKSYLNNGNDGLNQLLEFNVYSSNNITTDNNNPYVIVAVYAVLTTAGVNTTAPVPIITVNGSICLPSNDQKLCQKSITAAAGEPDISNYRFAAIFPNNDAKTAMKIGINLQDLCIGVHAQNHSDAAGCSGGSFVASTTPIQLIFEIGQAPAGELFNTNITPDKSNTIKVQVQTTGPTLSCDMSGTSYFPGDSEIYVDSGRFGVAQNSWSSPVDTLIMIANDNHGNPDTSLNALSRNEIVSRVPYPSGGSLGGFTNTTDGTDHQYKVAFTVRDKAGIVATAPLTSGSCQLDGVQTSPIHGFLNKNHCFIATAAFRAADSPALALLRDFRDHILLASPPGRAFVQWYYHWSPSAADWLVDHPILRFPVLMALLPLQAGAWLLLHPAWLMLMGLLGGTLILALLRMQQKEARRG